MSTEQIIQLLAAVVSDMTIIDIIDILMISYAVYRVLIFIEDTRASNLLKGLGVIFLVSVATKELNLNTVNHILEAFLPTSILVFFIIFQPEVRRGLEDLGKSRFLHEQRASDSEIDEITNEICKTIETAAKKRIGILIVIEQAIGLKDFVDNGTTLHSKVTTELLNTIFMPFTPLHDGAVIIKGNLIEAAGCFLPTASNHKEVAKELGSRHRAAIGLTEMTDAIVFIVSEETGQVSKARGGKLDRNLSQDNIRRLVKTSLLKIAKYRSEHGDDQK